MAADLGERFEAAVTMAHELHRSRTSNGTERPYLAHLLAVTSLVLDGGGDEDAAIAAVLHDAAENQRGTAILAVITETFGPHVGAIVDACSDTIEYPTRPTIEQKGRYIERLDNDATVRDVLLVSLADKLQTLRSILADFRSVGPGLWDRFNLGPTDQLWYYRSLAELYRRRLGGPMSAELDRLLVELAGALATPSELRWATLAALPDCGFAALGDPDAIDAPPRPERGPKGWTQLVDDSAVGLVCGTAETDELPVQIGLTGSRVVAARIEFVTNLDQLTEAGEGTWEDVGQLVCDHVIAVDLQKHDDPAYRIELPLPPGAYRASTFRDSGGDALGILLRATRTG
jgi:hypothetical protein